MPKLDIDEQNLVEKTNFNQTPEDITVQIVNQGLKIVYNRTMTITIQHLMPGA